jgi:(p)ppGpp synthase/HD superfamily hydrolase
MTIPKERRMPQLRRLVPGVLRGILNDNERGTHLAKRFDDALVMASEIHREQPRKGSQTPYIAHLMAVTAIVLEHGGNEDEAIAALLHDAAEDQGGRTRLKEIHGKFGKPVEEIVEGCTDTLEDPKPSWGPRKRRYIERLETEPHSVRLVAAADKLHNARSVLADYQSTGEALWSRFNGGREGTLWFYRAVTNALKAGAQPGEDRLDSLIRALDRTVIELEHAANGGARITRYPGPD